VGRAVHVLLAEDNPGDVFLIREALQLQELDFELMVLPDGEEMFALIDRIDAGTVPCPDIVLLDLNLPKQSGETLLERMRESPVCSQVPIIIVTSSASPKDRETASRLGASSYFQKPSDFEEFMRLGSVVKRFVS
jgi:two-component system, chemotaxis family, response regulator Rcp1